MNKDISLSAKEALMINYRIRQTEFGGTRQLTETPAWDCY